MKIAFVTSRFPFPIEKGDKLRAYHQLRYLSRSHEILLIALNDKPVQPADREEIRKYCSAMHVFEMRPFQVGANLIRAFLNGIPLQVGYFTNARIKSRIQQILISEQPDHIYAQLIRTGEYVRALPIAKTLDYMDVFSVGMRQRASSAPFFLKPFFRHEADKLAEYERRIYRDFDFHTIISDQDRRRLPLNFQENVKVVPNGVDLTFFRPDKSVVPDYDIAFVGNMGYRPNIEAAILLVRKIMPEIWKEKSHARVLIAGARPTMAVKRLAGKRVTVSGWIPDIRDAYQRAKIFVAPIFSGIGQQNKILEAFAMQMPCVISSMVNHAIGAKANTSVLLADQPEVFVRQMLRLLDAEDLREKIGASARSFIEAQYSWERQTKALEELLLKPEASSFTH